MPNILYCAYFDGALMHGHVEEILGKMSDSVSAKELLNNITDIQKMSS